MTERLADAAFRLVGAGVPVPSSRMAQKYSNTNFPIDLIRRLRIDYLLNAGARKGQYASRLRRSAPAARTGDRPQTEQSARPHDKDQPRYTQPLERLEDLSFSGMNLSLTTYEPTDAVGEYDCLMARNNQLS